MNIGSFAPYGTPDLDYFAGMGKDNLDDIKQFVTDRAAAREKSYIATVSRCCSARRSNSAMR
jgi:hypothetical protein